MVLIFMSSIVNLFSFTAFNNGNAVSNPVNQDIQVFFSVFKCGAWSVAKQSIISYFPMHLYPLLYSKQVLLS